MHIILLKATLTERLFIANRYFNSLGAIGDLVGKASQRGVWPTAFP